MGIKLLIIQACMLPLPDAPHQPLDVGDTIEVGKDEAGTLTRIGRALYLSRDDDHSKGLLTATSDVQKQVKDQAKLIKQEREAAASAAAAQTAAGQTAAIAAAVKAALEAAGIVAKQPA